MTISNNSFKISNNTIGNNCPVYFIADIAANHDGDLERSKDLIYLAADSGANAAKFQHFQAKSIVSDYGFKSLGPIKSHQSSWNKSVYEIYQDASLNIDWTYSLYETCQKANITFFSTPYNLEVIDLIDEYVPAYKIGSGDITYFELIEKVAMKMKPYMLATGASSFDDVHRAVSFATAINPLLCLMQCNTNYTGNLENFKHIHLNVLNTYKSMYPNIILGLSDHTPGHSTVLGAVALGAKIIEKHFTDDNSRIGPDHLFSMNPISWREMVSRTRELEMSLGTGVKVIEENEIETSILQRRSLRAVSNFNKNHVVTSNDFIALRPAPSDALAPYNFSKIVGKKLRREISKGDYLKITDIDL